MWGGNGLKWKFSLQIISRFTCKERERERDRTQSPKPFDFAPFNFAVRLRLRITPRSHPSTSSANPEPRSRLQLCRDCTEMAPIALIALRSQLRNGWVLMNLTGFDEFFFVGFCFCVYLLRNGIIYLFGSWEKCEEQEENVFSILFLATQPNTRKYFPKNFLECNQTLENIFLSRK